MGWQVIGHDHRCKAAAASSVSRIHHASSIAARGVRIWLIFSENPEAEDSVMGGFGSGRHGGTVPAEGTASYVLTASMLTRGGRGATGVAHFDGGSFWVAIRVDISEPSDAFIELTHQTRDEREGDRIVRDRIRLVSTVPAYGGRRWWFQCPRTYRKTTKLYLPNGGRHFWSRRAYGLGYACQREDRFSRLQRRAKMLNRQLGGEGWGSC